MPFVARLTARLLGARGAGLVEPYDTAELRTLARDDGLWELVGTADGAEHSILPTGSH